MKKMKKMKNNINIKSSINTMKKILFLAACIGMMASCSSDAFLGEEAVQETPVKSLPIQFSSTSSMLQKATATGADAAKLLNNKFVVYGANTADGTAYAPVFDNYQVTFAANTGGTTESNTDDWEYVGNTSLKNAVQNIKYWDLAQKKYQFVAVSGLGSGEMITDQNGFSVAVDATKAGDLYVSDRVTVEPANYNKTVQLQFRRLTSRMRVGIYETIPGYAVKDVKFHYTTQAAGSTTVGLGCNFPKEGTYTVTYSADDKAQVSFPTPEKGNIQRYMQFGTMDYTSAASTSGDASKPYIDANGVPTATEEKIFLGTSSTTATYGKGTYTIDGVAGTESYYRPILPCEANATPMYLSVDFTLVATDGSGSTIEVRQASAVVPAAYTKWKPNYSYTYLFKITDKVNGTTDPNIPDPTEPSDPGTPIDPDDPDDPSVPDVPTDPDDPDPTKPSLYPITFDAVVISADENGNQETITTVATPSITTYQDGVVVTTTNEYKAGNIDITVSGKNDMNTKGKLYLIDATHALTAVSEATIVDALNIVETTSGSSVTGRNGIKLDEVLTSGDGSKRSFTAAEHKTYAYVYEVNDDADTYIYTNVAVSAGDDVSGLYTMTGVDTYAPCGAGAVAAAGTSYYKRYTNSNIQYSVKVIKVQ